MQSSLIDLPPAVGPATVLLASGSPAVVLVPEQIVVTGAPIFQFDVLPGTMTSTTLIQVTASYYGTTATASVILQPQQ